jgi:uncharacterized membrane protein
VEPSPLDRVEELGPVQVLVVVFDDVARLQGHVLDELLRLRQLDVVRLIDLVAVARDDDGELRIVQQSDLDAEGAAAFGSILRMLIGVGPEDDRDGLTSAALGGAAELEDGHVFADADVWYLADMVPAGSAAAVALIEHHWAVPLELRIKEAGGTVAGNEWIHPADLVAARAGIARATPVN